MQGSAPWLGISVPVLPDADPAATHALSLRLEPMTAMATFGSLHFIGSDPSPT